jgi:hypothetical protein
MDKQAVLALCHEHAQAEAEFNIDRVLATLVPEPRYEFFPLARAMSGWTNIEAFYRQQYPQFAPDVVGYDLRGEWVNEHATVQEYVIDIRDGGGAVSYHVMSMMPVDDHARLLTGERLYCDEGFVLALLGPFYDRLEPIAHL